MSPPFALFVIANDISIEAINRKIEQAYADPTCVVPGSLYLVKGSKYPAFDPQGPTDGYTLQGTLPPITDFSNSFKGTSIDKAAEWLQNGPSSMFLARKLFAVLDNYSEANDTITICRRNPKKENGSFYSENEYGEVQYFPKDSSRAIITLTASDGNDFIFDQALEGYQMRRRVRQDSGPDLSKGTPPWTIGKGGLEDDIDKDNKAMNTSRL